MLKGSFEWALTGLKRGAVMKRDLWRDGFPIVLWKSMAGYGSSFIFQEQWLSCIPKIWTPSPEDLMADDWREVGTKVMDFDRGGGK